MSIQVSTSAGFHPEKLTSLPKDQFDNVFQIYQELGIYERHFNNINSIYKSLASTWLLAFFAGVGYILLEFPDGMKWWEKDLVITSMGIGTAVGIYLIWLIDMRVYQNLLTGCFYQGLQLEQVYDWLPPTRHMMINSQLGGRARENLAWFYKVGLTLPMGVAIIASAFFLYRLPELLSTFKLSWSIQLALPLLSLLLLWPLRIGIRRFDRLGKEKASVSQLLFEHKQLQADYDYKAPDTSERRPLCKTVNGKMVHVTLNKGLSHAVTHNSVTEIWYCLEGEGKFWRKNAEQEEIIEVTAGQCLTIPIGTSFQFRNDLEIPLTFVIATMPSWSGVHQAVKTKGKW